MPIKIHLWTPEEIQKLKDISASGGSVKDAARKLNLKYADIYNCMRYRGIPFKTRAKSVTKKEEILIIECAQRGLTLRQTEAQLGIPYARIRYIAMKKRISFERGPRARKVDAESSSRVVPIRKKRTPFYSPIREYSKVLDAMITPFDVTPGCRHLYPKLFEPYLKELKKNERI